MIMIKLITIASILIALSCSSKKQAAKASTEINTAAAAAKPDLAVAATESDKGFATTVKIIRTSCASLVAIFTDDNMRDKGESWAPYNVRMAQPYKGAFTIMNLTDFPKIKEGFVFKANLIAEVDAPKKNFSICKMMDYPPATKYYVSALTEPKEEQ